MFTANISSTQCWIYSPNIVNVNFTRDTRWLQRYIGSVIYIISEKLYVPPLFIIMNNFPLICNHPPESYGLRSYEPFPVVVPFRPLTLYYTWLNKTLQTNAEICYCDYSIVLTTGRLISVPQSDHVRMVHATPGRDPRSARINRYWFAPPRYTKV